MSEHLYRIGIMVIALVALQRAVAMAELGETLSAAMAAVGSMDNEPISGTN